MRICILGKADVPVCNVARFAVARGHEVHLVMGLAEEPIPEGVVAHRLSSTGKLGFLLAGGTVRRLVGRIRPDVLHAFFLTSYGYLASRVPRVPVLATAMGTDVFGAPELSGWLEPLRRSLTRRAIRRADRIHSVAEHMTRRLAELGAEPSKVVTFPRGIPLERFPFRERRPAAGPCRAICNRRLEPVYDHRTLFAAAARLRDAGVDLRLSIFGSGSLRDELQAQAAVAKLADSVEFAGNVTHKEMPGALSRSELFVSASLSDGTSSCLLEALAAGCIPVVSDIPANRPWVRDGDNGFLFRPGDAASLAQAVDRALAAGERWPEIGRSNRALVERRAGLDQGCERVLGLYEEIRASRGRPE